MRLVASTRSGSILKNRFINSRPDSLDRFVLICTCRAYKSLLGLCTGKTDLVCCASFPASFVKWFMKPPCAMSSIGCPEISKDFNKWDFFSLIYRRWVLKLRACRNELKVSPFQFLTLHFPLRRMIIWAKKPYIFWNSKKNLTEMVLVFSGTKVLRYWILGQWFFAG